MFRNYFKTAFRSLFRNRNYTTINIAGLAAGIAVCLSIFIIIRYELSYDNFHKKKDRIYRVLTEYHHADAPDVFYGKGVPEPLPAAIRANFPQVEKTAAFMALYDDQMLVLNENGQTVKKFKEEKGIYITEPSFFDIFDYPLLAGDPATALKEFNSAILSKETAERYFGNWKDAMGKMIKWNGNTSVKITGILAPIPDNTDLKLKVVMSFGTGWTRRLLKSNNWDGTSSDFGCFVLFSPGLSESTFNTQLRAYVKKVKSPENKDTHLVQSLSKIHFATKVGDFSGETISPELIRILWLIAGFILLIACVNFINLSTAQAVNRAKEIGVRKVMGSNRWQLKVQFLVETFLIVTAAVIIAIGITAITLPSIGKILERSVSFNILRDPFIVLFLLSSTVLVTFLAGFYPSLVLSRFNPINALKSRLSAKSTKGVTLRRGLVVFQFIIAQGLIIGTLIIVKQMNYFTSRPLGFDKDAVVNLTMPFDSASNTKLDYLRKKIQTVQGVQSVSFSSNTPIENNTDNWTTFIFNGAAKETEFYAINKWIDHEFQPTYKIPLVAGRNLEPSDTVREFLVNEELVKKLGITPEQVLNKQISMWGGFVKGTVVGVLKDFNARTLKDGIPPVLFTTEKRGFSVAGIKLASHNLPVTVKAIEKVWNETFPDYVSEYRFLDDKIESFYKQESRLSYLYKIFAGIAIFLSCLGLYGLASFMAVQRIKEVGIRKVLGATATHIVYLFSKEFVILITIAFLVASPVAWYFMHEWLKNYVYRIDISWWIFIIGGIASIVIAVISVSFQAIKAAFANPVKSLRSE